MTDVITVRVAVEGGSYDVVIGSGLLDRAGELAFAAAPARNVAIISDTTVDALFGVRVAAKFVTAGFDVHPLAFEAGETSKNWPVAGEMLEALAGLGLDRTDLVVALGGGVVGDLAGFCAATYLRGVRFVQIPTTLLAQVDSSVGGKTGVDLRAGKNLAGAFKQPEIVVADIDILASLPLPEWNSGLAEVAKSAVIESEAFLSWLEDHAQGMVSRESTTVGEAVSRCVTFKSGVVSADEREEGVRECLNYGHTLGHAIENVAGYGAIPHGLAVAEGMRFASRLSVEVLGSDRAFFKRTDALLDSLGLASLDVELPADELLQAMRSDKKARSGSIRFVLADAPGSWTCTAVDDRVIAEHLRAWSASKRKG